METLDRFNQGAVKARLVHLPFGPGEQPGSAPERGDRDIERMIADSLKLSQAATPGISPEGRADMERLARVANSRAGGKSPEGWCYREVWGHLMASGYAKLTQTSIPDSHSAYARQFGEYLNVGNNAKRLGMQRLPIDNPYDAPKGAIVVVRPGTPGTAHPVAGDIAVAMGGGRFLNDGEMSYGGRANFPPGNRHVIGIYAPL
ncbi:MAG: hypothetical protein VKP57_02090 [Candidatus Sericytochromatia bacterium]|nr:hypothetical protein [Candidatus Sericytochromatia bacterium]